MFKWINKKIKEVWKDAWLEEGAGHLKRQIFIIVEREIQPLKKDMQTLEDDMASSLMSDERREKFYDKLNSHDKRVLEDRLERIEKEHEILWRKVNATKKGLTEQDLRDHLKNNPGYSLEEFLKSIGINIKGETQ